MSSTAHYRSLAIGLIVAMLYGAISLLIFGSEQSWLTNFVGWGPDPMSYIWGLNWWPWVVGNRLNPMVSHYVWYPAGFHMAWADTAPSAALIGLPLTLLGNAALTYNVFMLAAPAASALCAFLLIRYLTHNTLASLFAGYLFGFSSYQIGHGAGHLSLVLTFFVPIIVLLTIKRVTGDVSRRTFVGLLTIVMVVQFGISMEIFATACVFGAIAWLSAVAFAPPRYRCPLLVIASEITLATAVVLLVTSPWLISMYRGRADVPNIIHPPDQYGTDLLNFIVPTPLALFSAAFAKFSGNFAEATGYLGLPLVAILILWFCESRRTPAGRMLLCLFLLFSVLSIGSSLAVAGHQIYIWMPWRAFLHLPLIRHAIPGRFSMYVALIAATAAGYWFAAAQTARGRVGRYVLGLVAVAFVFPNPQIIKWNAVPSVPFFERDNLERTLGPMPNLIVLPLLNSASESGPSMMWQWQSGMAFTQSGGYVGDVPPVETTWAGFMSFYTGVVGTDFANYVTNYVAAHRIGAVVAGPDTQRPLLEGLDKLGWKQEEIGDLRIYHVPASGNLPYFTVSGDYWPGLDEWSWIGGNVTISAVGGDFQVKLSDAWRPPVLPPAVVEVSQDGKTQSVTIEPGKTAVIPLVAGHKVTLTSTSLFVPEEYLGNGDMRSLSVLLHVTN